MTPRKRHDVGETQPERIDREQGVRDETKALAHNVRGRVRGELILVAGLVIGLVVVGWVKVGGFAGDLRDAAVEACERQNEVRAAVTLSLREQNANARALDPALFPDIPPDQFRELTQQGIDTRQHAIQSLRPTDCEAEYPSD